MKVRSKRKRVLYQVSGGLSLEFFSRQKLSKSLIGHGDRYLGETFDRKES